MTPEQAFTVLDALLSKMETLQQLQHSTASPPSGESSRSQREEIFSFESISQAIRTFGNNDARTTLQEFFDTVLSSLTSMSPFFPSFAFCTNCALLFVVFCESKDTVI